MRNGWFWFKVKVLSFKIRFCNGDSDAQLTPATAHAQALAVIGPARGQRLTSRHTNLTNITSTKDKMQYGSRPKQQHS